MRTFRSAVLSAVLVPTLLFAAACGDDGNSEADKGASGAPSTTSGATTGAGGGKTPDTAQLQGALLTAADIGSGWEAGAEGVGADQKQTVVNEDCQALLGLLSPLSGATAPTGQAAGEFANSDSTSMVTIRLTSFSADGAKKVLDGAQSGLDQCKLISATDADGAMLSYAVTKLQAPSLGDQSIAFSAVVSDGTDSFKVAATSVRSGNTVETIVNMVLEGAAEQPAEALLKKQLDKVTAVS